MLAEVGRFGQAGMIEALKMLGPIPEGRHYAGRGAAAILGGGWLRRSIGSGSGRA